jgi:transcriptional regulator with XRE-family HTH domain
MTMKAMATELDVSSAYLSALEHGNRGRPAPGLIMQICELLDLTWDDAEEVKHLAALSHPRIVVDTAGLTPKATELANTLAERIGDLDEDTIEWILDEIRGRLASSRGPTH